ncbi:MAG TPA: helix-turn-helix domain-containing protein [Terriglobales bacterium]|nr:helix-turn-helix domain-containing protein [Terriglobales bacterium]
MHVFAKGDRRTVQRLLRLRRQAQADKAPRVVLRIQGVLMSLDGYSTGEIARRLKVHRSGVPVWIDHWNEHGEEGLWEGHRSGRPPELNLRQREQLSDILDSGPVAYGLDTGIWTSPLVAEVIRGEFDCSYHPGHVRKLLRAMGYSVLRPTTRLVQADVRQKHKWTRYTYPNLKKTHKGKGR